VSLDPSSVSAALVTIGDVDLTPILESLPPEYEVVVWDNSRRPFDFKVFGRYVAITETTRPVIFFQDDDCVLTRDQHQQLLDAYEPGVVVGNMIYDDPVWRERYKDTTLLGWGALFDRGLPWQAFARWARHRPINWEFMTSPGGAEVVFPMLSRTKTVVAGAEWLHQDGTEVFGRPNRMSNQPGFLETRLGWLDAAREVRDLLAEEERR
jgi:hypothetical protein